MFEDKNYKISKNLKKQQDLYEKIRKFQKEENWVPISKEIILRLNEDEEDIVFQAGKEESKDGEVSVRFLIGKDPEKEWSDWIGTGENASGFDATTITHIAEKEAKRVLEEAGGLEGLREKEEEIPEEEPEKEKEPEKDDEPPQININIKPRE
jgi:hypothetical protein